MLLSRQLTDALRNLYYRWKTILYRQRARRVARKLYVSPRGPDKIAQPSSSGEPVSRSSAIRHDAIESDPEAASLWKTVHGFGLSSSISHVSAVEIYGVLFRENEDVPASAYPADAALKRILFVP